MLGITVGTSTSADRSVISCDGFLYSDWPCKHYEPKIAPEKVIFNNPATIVYWHDGTKTVVRCQDGDVYDEREGFLLCCAKKLMGDGGSYNDAMRNLGVPDRHGKGICLHGIKDVLD